MRQTATERRVPAAGIAGWLIGAVLSTWASSVAAEEPAPSATDILSGKAPPIDYSKAERCLRSENIERTEPLNDKYLLFHLRGKQAWLAQFPQRCPGLTPQSKLLFEKDEPRICEWDSVRVVYDNGIGVTPTYGPRCNLPKFEPISEEQVTMLKEAIVAARKSPASKQQH